MLGKNIRQTMFGPVMSRDRNLRDRAQISRRDRDFVIKAETEIKTKTWKFETETRDLTFL